MQLRFNEGLLAKSLVDEWHGGFEGPPQRDIRTQSAFFAFRSRGSNHLFFHEVEHRLCLCLARLRVVFRPFLCLCREQGILLRLSLAVGGIQSVPPCFRLGLRSDKRLRFGANRPHCLPDGKPSAREKSPDDHSRSQHGAAIPPDKLLQPASRRRRPRQDRLVPQVTINVFRKVPGRGVAAVTVFFQRFHHQPVEVACQQLRELLHIQAAIGCDNRGRVSQ